MPNVLSERELEVMIAVNKGNRNKQIATLLGIAEKTVKNHLYAAYRALGATSRVDALNKAREAGYDLSGESK